MSRMGRIIGLIGVMLGLLVAKGHAGYEPLWLVTPSISPDGTRVAFSYRGVLYVVPTSGGEAQPLTTGRDYVRGPVWSPDGKRIAYASDMYGNFDVYTLSLDGGATERVTTGSADEFPFAYTPAGDSLIYRAQEMPAHKSALFYTRWTSQLYRIAVSGGREQLYLPMPAASMSFAPDGKTLLFEDVRGNEDEARKHHTSSIARDIWLYTPGSPSARQLIVREGEDRNPVFGADSDHFYFLSERDGGSFNVYASSVSAPSQVQQLTRFARNPVRALTASRSGMLCFTYDGRIYTMPAAGGEPQVLNVSIARPDGAPDSVFMRLKSASDGVISPNGKEVAFVSRGDVYVSSIEFGNTRQITNTPEQERSVDWAPDGRSLVYAGERHGSWNLYMASITRSDEPSFAGATSITEKPLLVTAQETFQPRFSPDGKEVAFIEDRTKIRVINLATKQVRSVTDGSQNYSYQDGDISYEWSPDSKWIVLSFDAKRRWPNSDIGLVRASGTEPIFNLTQSGYTDTNPRFMMNGDVIIWHSDRNGYRSHASWGAQEDVYAFFINREAYAKYRLTPFELDELKAAKEQGSDSVKDAKKGKGKKEAASTPSKTKDLNIDLTNVEDRIVRLTIHSSSLADAIVTPDGESLYYLCSFEGKFNLWKTDLRKRSTKRVLDVKMDGGSLSLDSKGENMLIATGDRMVKVNLKSEKQTDVAISAPFTHRGAQERAYIFDHAWRQVINKFYRSDLHGVDWKYYREVYEKFLPYINNNYDFTDMLSELLGELNASHTGSGYRSPGLPGGPRTASLGVFYDRSFAGPGIRITEVLRGGPLDETKVKVKAGTVITSIDGVAVRDFADLPRLLDRKEGERVRIELREGAATRSEVVKPISRGTLNNLMYERWVEQRRREVDSLSGGRLGYVHIRGMNAGSFRTVYSDLFGRYNDREGVVIDTRYNGGGHLHEDVEVLFSGHKYLDLVPREQVISEHPRKRWKKPSVMLIGEANYSNAHGTPWVYKTQGLGKLVGKPVPGTMTSVWWETQVDPTIYFGVPIVGYVDRNGRYLENQQLEPDVDVALDYFKLQQGHDTQIEKAVQVLLEAADAAKADSPWPEIEKRFR